MTAPLIVTVTFYLALGGLCVRWPVVGRRCAGVFFLLMGFVVHGYIVVANPEAYINVADEIAISTYRSLALWLVEPSPRAFGVLVGCFEIMVGYMLLRRDGLCRVGLMGAIVFLIAITPLSSFTLPNLLLAAALGYVLWRELDVPRRRRKVSDLWPVVAGDEPEHRQRFGVR